ncbi:MAG: hypothetical protein ACI4PL_03130 [Faecousia sp.]
MSTTDVLNPVHNRRRGLMEREQTAFDSIPGMDILRRCAPEHIPELEAKYPDAAFALMITQSLFAGDREQNEIHQRAYAAILNGEPINGVRFKYDYDLESYLLKHMWD